MCGKLLCVNKSYKSYKLIAVHLASIALSFLYSFDTCAHTYCSKLYLKCAFQYKKAPSRRLVALCVTLILPRVAEVIDKQFQMDQWQMVILMAWQYLVNNSKYSVC